MDTKHRFAEYLSIPDGREELRGKVSNRLPGEAGGPDEEMPVREPFPDRPSNWHGHAADRIRRK